MALRKFFFGFNASEFKKLQILFFNGESAGMIPKDTADEMYWTMERFFFVRMFSLGFCGICTYMVPVPLEYIFMVPMKLVIFSFSHRSLTFIGKMDCLNKLSKICEDFNLNNKVDEMKLNESDRIFLKSFSEEKDKFK